MNKIFIYFIFLIFIMVIAGPLFSIDQKPKMPNNDIEYLEDLYKATFDGISYFVHPGSGLPYDVSNYKSETSTSNIGLYIACVAVAAETGLIEKKEAINKIDMAFTSLEKIKKWHGFPVTWVDIENMTQAYGSGFSYADHVGNLVFSLIVLAEIFSDEFGKRVDKYIKPMKFNITYDKDVGMIKGGYDTSKRDFTVKQSWGNWYYSLLASDQRQFCITGIALGDIPEKAWDKMLRDNYPWGNFDREVLGAVFKEDTYKTPYYSPGLEGGGLFMQLLPGIFLDEKELPVGISAKNMAFCLIKFSKKIKQYPLWGISSCESADGLSYVGWGNLKKSVITPHASVLAIEYFPKEAMDNLKELEKRGVRPKYKDENGEEKDFGFTDSYDTQKDIASEHYLVLDQSMLFLSLANFLHDEVARKKFNEHKLGNKINNKMRELEKEYEPFDITKWK